MNVLGVGGPEFVLIFLIMLVIAGPKRMIHWSYILGQYVNKGRNLWRQTAKMIQAEFDEAGLDVKVPTQLPTRQNIAKMTTSALKPLQEIADEVEKEVQQVNQKTKLPVMNFNNPKKPTAKNGVNSREYGVWSQSKDSDSDSESDYGSWSQNNRSNESNNDKGE